jgi:hypothetical protein
VGLEEAFGARDGSSDAMQAALGRWFSAYYEGGALQLPFTIVRKLTRAVFSEFRMENDLGKLPHRAALELALIGGESYLAPHFGDGRWHWRVIPRSSILVFARDGEGEPIDVGLTEKRLQGNHWFTLLERRRLDRRGLLTVTNRLFRSNSRGVLGREVSLRACPAYEALPKTYTYGQSLGGLGLVRLRLPMANCIDGSAEGVSIYAPAMNLMESLEENEALLRQEFQNGASRIVVSRDMLRDGKLEDSLFVGLDEAPENVGITVFSPELREQSFLARQDSGLRMLENMIGLKRGLLSEVEAADRTATEITSSEGEYMTTLLELRRAWEQTLEGCARLLAALEGRTPETLQISWGDGIV